MQRPRKSLSMLENLFLKAGCDDPGEKKLSPLMSFIQLKAPDRFSLAASQEEELSMR
jgi:hypothetical protein